MNWKAHLLIGAVLCAIFVGVMNATQGWYNLDDLFVVISIIILSVVSPLLPDLDHERGKLREWLIKIGIITTLIGAILWFFSVQYHFRGEEIFMFITFGGISIALVTYFVSQYAHHRGFMHSITFALMYGIAMFLLLKFNWQLGILATFGSLTHTTLDGIFKLK